MKKMLIALLVTASVFFTLVFTLGTVGRNKGDEFKVAMVTDFSDVNDGSFNQACYEGAKEWSRRHNVTFNYYKPASISPAERIKSNWVYLCVQGALNALGIKILAQAYQPIILASAITEGNMNIFYLADLRDGKTGYHPWALFETDDFCTYEDKGIVIPYADSERVGS